MKHTIVTYLFVALILSQNSMGFPDKESFYRDKRNGRGASRNSSKNKNEPKPAPSSAIPEDSWNNPKIRYEKTSKKSDVIYPVYRSVANKADVANHNSAASQKSSSNQTESQTSSVPNENASNSKNESSKGSTGKIDLDSQSMPSKGNNINVTGGITKNNVPNQNISIIGTVNISGIPDKALSNQNVSPKTSPVLEEKSGSDYKSVANKADIDQFYSQPANNTASGTRGALSCTVSNNSSNIPNSPKVTDSSKSNLNPDSMASDKSVVDESVSVASSNSSSNGSRTRGVINAAVSTEPINSANIQDSPVTSSTPKTNIASDYESVADKANKVKFDLADPSKNSSNQIKITACMVNGESPNSNQSNDQSSSTKAVTMSIAKIDLSAKPEKKVDIDRSYLVKETIDKKESSGETTSDHKKTTNGSTRNKLSTSIKDQEISEVHYINTEAQNHTDVEQTKLLLNKYGQELTKIKEKDRQAIQDLSLLKFKALCLAKGLSQEEVWHKVLENRYEIARLLEQNGYLKSDIRDVVTCKWRPDIAFTVFYQGISLAQKALPYIANLFKGGVVVAAIYCSHEKTKNYKNSFEERLRNYESGPAEELPPLSACMTIRREADWQIAGGYYDRVYSPKEITEMRAKGITNPILTLDENGKLAADLGSALPVDFRFKFFDEPAPVEKNQNEKEQKTLTEKKSTSTNQKAENEKKQAATIAESNNQQKTVPVKSKTSDNVSSDEKKMPASSTRNVKDMFEVNHRSFKDYLPSEENRKITLGFENSYRHIPQERDKKSLKEKSSATNELEKSSQKNTNNNKKTENAKNQTSMAGGSPDPEDPNNRYRNGRYENAPYHGRKGNSIKSKAPDDGQEALYRSVPFKDTSKNRIGISNGEFVVLSWTQKDLYHGHVRSWDELDDDMKNALRDAGWVNHRGKIIK